MYLMVLEVVLLGFVVFIVAPILFVSQHHISSLFGDVMFYILALLEHIPGMHRSTPTPDNINDQT